MLTLSSAFHSTATISSNGSNSGSSSKDRSMEKDKRRSSYASEKHSDGGKDLSSRHPGLSESQRKLHSGIRKNSVQTRTETRR